MTTKLSRPERDELRCIAQGRPHGERPQRVTVRKKLQTAGLAVWWIDPYPTEDYSQTRWLITGRGVEALEEA